MKITNSHYNQMWNSKTYFNIDEILQLPPKTFRFFLEHMDSDDISTFYGSLKEYKSGYFDTIDDQIQELQERKKRFTEVEDKLKLLNLFT